MNKRQIQGYETSFCFAVFGFVGTISHCLAVSRRFLSMDYVTSVRIILSDIEEDLFFALFERRRNIKRIEYFKASYSLFINEEVIKRVDKLEKVLYIDCKPSFFPIIDVQNVQYHFDDTSFTWNMSFEKDRNVDVIFIGNDSKYWIMMDFQYHGPQSILRLIISSVCRFGRYRFGPIMPYVKGTQTELMTQSQKSILYDLYMFGWQSIDTELMNGQEEEEGAQCAVVKIITHSGRTIVALFEKSTCVWKFCSISEYIFF